MEQITRHLVSQHFGRVVAQVDFDGNRDGIVHLSLERPHRLAIQFTFLSSAVERIFGDALSWKEMVVRLAVSQAHKLHLKDQISIALRAEPLNVNGQPWVGDLLFAPYGGATHGLDPDVRKSPHSGYGRVPAWPGFSHRLKTALRKAGCHAGPRTLSREFNARTADARLSARTARHWLSGLATPAPEQLPVLAAWLGVTAEWLRRGQCDHAQGGDPAAGEVQRGVPATTLEPASETPASDRRQRARRCRRMDRRTATLIDRALELQRTKGDKYATAFLVNNEISEHIALRVLACAAFRRKPSGSISVSIGASYSPSRELEQE